MFTDSQPKLDIKKSTLDYSLEFITFALVIGCIIYVAYHYGNLPDNVPGHMNLAGKVNRYDAKETVWILPILNTFLVFGIYYLNKFPHIFNYNIKINKDNAEKQYKAATTVMRIVNLLMAVLFFTITYQIINISLSESSQASKASSYIINTILIALVAFPIILLVLNLKKKKS